MDLSPSAQRGLGEQSRRARIEALLKRYPDIDAGETGEILHFLKKGPPLEAALLTTNDRLRPKLDSFREDHRADFSLGLKHYLAVAIIVAGLVVLLGLLWDSGIA
ncbi:MAG TPA: hypothetical protein VFR28_05920 [Allosphingosinicella sp.]|jgi:hypothetical protein|nr:hypothetical protein [Allosphingosinicella sp.]